MKSSWKRFRYLSTLVFLSAGALLAQRQVAVSTVSHSTADSNSVKAFDSTSCPNQGGLLDSISVPVGQPLSLYVYVSSPPRVNETFDLTISDATIASAGDTTQAFLGSVTVPAGQQYSQAFSLLGKSVGRTALVIGSESGDYLPSQTPLTAWDINPTADPNMKKFLDANPSSAATCRAPGSADVSQDPSVLATCGTPVSGAAADGVTKLLMRLQAGLPGTACFTVTSAGSNQGTISAAVANTQEFAQSDYAFSLYQAPDASALATSSNATAAVNTAAAPSIRASDEAGSTTVQVQFAFTPSLGNGNTTSFTSQFTLVPPPLLLIHGLWSKPGAWKDAIWQRSPADMYPTTKADYTGTNSSSFDVNVPTIESAVQEATDKLRAGGYAGTEVDVIAHSMGGNLARLYVGSADYMRPDNYGLGDIHRLITLDTPHYGSNLANLIVALYSNNPDAQGIARTFASLAAHDITQGAVCDLAENSQALTALSSSTNVPAQVITATGGPPNKYTPVLETALSVVKYLLFGSRTYPETIVDAYRFSSPNDGVVAQSSQQDGKPGQPGILGTNFYSLLHSGKGGVLESPAVANQSFALLQEDAHASTLQPLPGVASSGDGTALTTVGLSADKNGYKAECLGSNPPLKQSVFTGQSRSLRRQIAAAAAQAGDGRIKIISPVEGQQFAPGSAVNVELMLDSSVTPASIDVAVVGIGDFASTSGTGNTYNVSFTIPSDYDGPALALVPGVVDASNNDIQGAQVDINVRPSGTVTGLSLSQSYNFFESTNRQNQIEVEGTFTGGQTAALTLSSTGTTYSSSNTSVLTVSSEGLVQVLNYGVAVVTVQNSGIKAFATYIVEKPATPLPPQDFTSSVSFTATGFRLDRTTGFFVQTVTITNTSPVPLAGPLYFALQSVPGGVRLTKAGTTQTIQPAGSPYLAMTLPDRLTLQPGASVSFNLQFLNPSRTQIAYSPKVYRTLATP